MCDKQLNVAIQFLDRNFDGLLPCDVENVFVAYYLFLKYKMSYIILYKSTFKYNILTLKFTLK